MKPLFFVILGLTLFIMLLPIILSVLLILLIFVLAGLISYLLFRWRQRRESEPAPDTD